MEGNLGEECEGSNQALLSLRVSQPCKNCNWGLKQMFHAHIYSDKDGEILRLVRETNIRIIVDIYSLSM